MYLTALAYELGESHPATELRESVDGEILESLLDDGIVNFRRSRVSRSLLSAHSFARTLDAWQGDPDTLDLILYCSETMSPDVRAGPEFHHFCNGRGLSKTPIVGLSLSRCGNLMPALRFARSQIRGEGLRNVAIVTADTGVDSRRVAQMNLAILSDGAASCIVTGNPQGAEFRLLGMAQTSDHEVLELDIGTHRLQLLQIIANGIRRAKRAALADAGLESAAVGHLYCATMRLGAVKFMAQLCGIKPSNTFDGCVAATSHVFSADLIVNLIESGDWRAAQGLTAKPFLALLMGTNTWGALVAESVDPDSSDR